jgi:SAM-dependent methyltransferase
MLYRTTDKPTKQLIYFALLRDGWMFRGRKIGLDLGCKAMMNYPIFRTQEYYGIDLDADALERGRATFPKAKAIHSRIEDADLPPADFAVCANVFHATNSKDWKPAAVLTRIVDAIAPGGILLINLQPKKEEFDEMVDLLESRFEQVDMVPVDLPIGRQPWSKTRAAYHLFLKPKPPRERWTRAYFRCVGRNPSP